MFAKLKAAFAKFKKKAEENVEDTEDIVSEDTQEEVEQNREKPKRTSILKAITETKLSESKFTDLFNDLEIELLQNNVAYGVVEKIKDRLRETLVNQSVKRKDVSKIVGEELRSLVLEVLSEPKAVDLLKQNKKPLVLMFVGVNGVGKTTSMAKVANYLQKNKKSCIFAASDTFRAASIEQLQAHADKLKIKMIKHKYGADPAAVAFDAVDSAKAKGIDTVLIDTAGRQQSSADLMDELKKIKRVAKPDLTILIVDALTGNDAAEQASSFNEAIGIDAVIITKFDADEKGGTVVSVVCETKKPVLFLGTGQKYENLQPFNRDAYASALFQQ